MDPVRRNRTSDIAEGRIIMVTDTARRDRDAALAEELIAHHAVMVADMDRLSTALADAAAAGTDNDAPHRALRAWVHDVLVPHAAEEEETVYRAAAKLVEGALLIRSMLAEHVLIREIAAHMADATDPGQAGAYGRALFAIFESHQRKENELILPLLVAADELSLTEVMGVAHGHSHCAHAHHH
jgi:Hemerythrin HHE cation binding domain